MSRAYNFSAGPAILPQEVLEEAQTDLVDYKGCGMSIIESSHRGKEYSAIHNEAVANFAELLDLSDDYSVLFMHGGASTQFALVPMNLLGKGKTADYTDSGTWASKAIKEARKIGNVNIAADCAKDTPTRVPTIDEMNLTDGAAYVHITSNETISGAQWKEFPKTEAPLVADMSSDILSRPFDVNQFGMIYAGAQKNLGPAGTALVIIRKELADRVDDSVPTMFKYATHIDKNSLFNTPPCFTIYVMMLVSRWLKKVGIENIHRQNVEKASKLYETIDASSFYTGAAAVECRSDMNVTFTLPSEKLDALFVKEADEQNMKGLKGHRDVGGLRASIYNAFPPEGVDTLVAFMKNFEAKNG